MCCVQCGVVLCRWCVVLCCIVLRCVVWCCAVLCCVCWWMYVGVSAVGCKGMPEKNILRITWPPTFGKSRATCGKPSEPLTVGPGLDTACLPARSSGPGVALLLPRESVSSCWRPPRPSDSRSPTSLGTSRVRPILCASRRKVRLSRGYRGGPCLSPRCPDNPVGWRPPSSAPVEPRPPS